MSLAFALMWSSALTSARIIVADAWPLYALALRSLLSGLIGVAITHAMGQTWHLTPTQWKVKILFGICQNAHYLGLNFVGMQTVKVSLAAIIASAMPLLVALFKWIILLGDGLKPIAVAALFAVAIPFEPFSLNPSWPLLTPPCLGGQNWLDPPRDRGCIRLRVRHPGPHHNTIAINQNFVEIPPRRKPVLGLHCLIKRMLIGPNHMRDIRHRHIDPAIHLAKLFDLFRRCQILIEIIRRHRQDHKPMIPLVVIELLQVRVLPGQPALRRRVRHQNRLPSPIFNSQGSAINRRKGTRHTGHCHLRNQAKQDCNE